MGLKKEGESYPKLKLVNIMETRVVCSNEPVRLDYIKLKKTPSCFLIILGSYVIIIRRSINGIKHLCKHMHHQIQMFMEPILQFCFMNVTIEKILSSSIDPII
jgi:hypothetical protein